jgi:hypothetical protein
LTPQNYDDFFMQLVRDFFIRLSGPGEEFSRKPDGQKRQADDQPAPGWNDYERAG